jgi:O-antigen ligase
MSYLNTMTISSIQAAEPSRSARSYAHWWIAIAMVTSIIPLYMRQQDYFGDLGVARQAFYFSVPTLIFCAVMLVRKDTWQAFAFRNLERSPLIVAYCLWLPFSQSALIVQQGVPASDLVSGIGYAVCALAAFSFIAVRLDEAMLAPWWNIVFWIAFAASAFGLIGALTGATSVLGIGLSLPRQMTELGGLYATAGFFSEKNMFGFATVLGILGGLYQLGRPSLKWRSRFWIRIRMAVCLGGLFFSWSRAMYIAMPVALFAWFIWNRKTSTKLLLIGSITCAVLIGAILPRLTAFDYLARTDLGISGRQFLWPAGLRAIAERPVFGYGLNSTALLEAVWGHGGYQWVEKEVGSHNGIIDIGIQTGFLSSVFYVSILVLSFWRLLSSAAPMHVKRSIFCGLLVCVIATMFLSYGIGGASYDALTLTTLLGIANAAPMHYGMRTANQG